jgi:hypothetical protein
LRHGFAATAAEAAPKLPAIKAVTCHKSDAIVGRYLKQADRIKTQSAPDPGRWARQHASALRRLGRDPHPSVTPTPDPHVLTRPRSATA